MAEELSAVQRLEQAVAAVPPDVTAARVAIGAVAESLQQVTGDEQVTLVQQTAVLAGRMVGAVQGTRRMRGRESAVQEFRTIATTYGLLASALGGEVPVQTQPTQTQGKAQTGGKS